MTIIDISWPLTDEMTPFISRKLFQSTKNKILDCHDCRESSVQLDSHAGTHLDAPSHFLQEGKTCEALPLDALIGPCRILDFSHLSEKITREDLEKEKEEIQAGERIILKTKNSSLASTAPFHSQFIYLDQSGAAYLTEKKVLLVGIDYLGIERDQPQFETHRLLLGNNISLLEGLRLESVAAGKYWLVCLPLAYQRLEAVPARAVLVEKDFPWQEWYN